MRQIKLFRLFRLSHVLCGQGRQEHFCPPRQKETWPPSSNSQIMTLKLSPPRCAISKENELINCDLENSFLLVYLSGPLIITHGHRGAPSHGWPPSQWACLWYLNGIHMAKFGLLIDRTSSIYLIMGLKALASVIVFYVLFHMFTRT